MLVAVERGPAGAAFPGKPGNIASRPSSPTDNEIYTINPAEGGKVQLTDNGTND